MSKEEHIDRMAESMCAYTFVMGNPVSVVDSDGEIVLAVLATVAVGSLIMAGAMFAIKKLVDRGSSNNFNAGQTTRSSSAPPSGGPSPTMSSRSTTNLSTTAKVQSGQNIGSPTAVRKVGTTTDKSVRVGQTGRTGSSSNVTVTAGSTQTQRWAASKIVSGGVIGAIVSKFSSSSTHKLAQNQLQKGMKQGSQQVRQKLGKHNATATKANRRSFMQPKSQGKGQGGAAASNNGNTTR